MGKNKKTNKKIDNIQKMIKSIYKFIPKKAQEMDKEIDIYSDDSTHPSSKSSKIPIEIDEKSKAKSIKFILNLLDIKDISLRITDNKISIDGELTMGKTKNWTTKAPSNKMSKMPSSTYSASAPSPKTDYVSVSVLKGQGFYANNGMSSPHYFICPNFYDEIKPLVVEKIKKIATKSLISFIDDITLSNGLSRNSNLDELINEKSQ